ncbi:Protein of unknown function [Nocardia amikacinitolerans]|uniref:SMODS and SLOG-associating 2TM effector domain-containing protein n=1 Tax=Nocardia amikacinitolerans TaxID=756689 RepID=A0A285LUD4_9NOCA|nr:DUF4231 domain-containing protein [Nocardia amikacinitolerans]MCP2280681.1 Protein of unknown function (DUF4231) [Nocardia amikacinitolerans]SNY88544.1 Protein of unknown function [Nocardia amikacinitolerans]
MSDDEAVAALWARRMRWARAADTAKRRADRTRVAVLCLSGVGAIATAATATVLRTSSMPQLVVAALGAVCLALATFLAAHFLTPAELRRWTRARAVAENIKQVIYRFRAGAQPFRDDDALLRLHQAVGEIEEPADDLLPFLTSNGADTAGLASGAPPVLTPEEYVRDRVQGQISGYYERRAREYAVRARRLRGAALLLGVAATVVAALGAVLVGASGRNSWAANLTPWVAVLTTLGAGVAGYLAGRRYEFLVMSYSATARRLGQLLREWRAEGSPTDEPRWTAFVDDCETVIAQQNETWVAKWTEPQPDGR